MAIRFGTSGWRAIIADEFTFANVKLTTEAICSYLTTAYQEVRQTIIIGHDSRFMGEQFAEVSAEIARSKGFRVLICENPTPTPAISFAIRQEKATGGINFTASHNPPAYQGIKFSTADGAPALPEITRQIEQIIENTPKVADKEGGTIEKYDACPAYLDDLKAKVNFELIAQAKGEIIYDAFWGTGRGYLNRILEESGLKVQTLHDWRDVTFEGKSPEPSERQIGDLREKVLSTGSLLGLATDGDADRFGIVDSNGKFIEPNQLIAILADYLIESRGWKLGIARSVATSHLIDKVAEYRQVSLFETPVGFKFIGELINKDEIVLGGEESAGLSIRGHYPEKDGILACLLAIEAVVARGKSLTQQLEELYEKVGRIESGRIGVKLTPQIAESLKDKLAQEPTEIGSKKVEKINRMDGVKFIFADGTWMLMRPSGTEPMVRIYAEAETKEDLEVLLEQGRNYLLG